MHLKVRFAIESILCHVTLYRFRVGQVTFQSSIQLKGNIDPTIHAEMQELARQCPFAKTLTGIVTISQVNAESIALLHLQHDAFGMAVEFGSIHAFDVGHAGGVFTLMLDTDSIFKDIRAFGQVVDEEVAGGVLG